MKKQLLKNPRARRMLDLIPLDKNEENHSSEYPTSISKADIAEELVTASVIQRSSKVKQSYDLRDLKTKYYDERDKENEDYSTDASSEYVPSLNREIQTPSSTSSFGGDSACIEKLIETNNKLWIGASKLILEQPTDKHSNLLYAKTPSHTPSCQEHRVEEDSGDETLKSNNGDNTLIPNETVVGNSPIIDITAEHENLHILQSIEMNQAKVSTLVINRELSNRQDIEIGQEVPQINDTYTVQSNELSSSDQENLQIENMPNNEQFEHSVTPNQNKLSRKRTCKMDEWKDKKNKAMKNSGKSYEGVRTKKKT
ncbi:unnamed protein product [Parnassius apollo]|uniref:(apollo) hypothetical protein n=1 Tax=Parnassius apollo TaxID=110799 RepID=A0A8S3WU09_PARAO|nr:unnamed protein product [Parnassius apollo]